MVGRGRAWLCDDCPERDRADAGGNLRRPGSYAGGYADDHPGRRGRTVQEVVTVADILIRGMEEPPRCSACRMLEGNTDDGFCHAADKWFDDEYFSWYQYPEGDIATDKPLNCPLIFLPEGHGRLIDADELMVKIKTESDFIEANFIRGETK